jgi:phosphatidylinositol-4,5-bisphosphate 3-kinase
VNNFGTVVEGDDRQLFDRFEKMCGRAYNVLRENKTLLMDLFVLMIPAGMPELTKRSDVAFMDDKLMLGMSHDEAAKHFAKEIKNALNTITRRIDNLAHTVKHYK